MTVKKKFSQQARELLESVTSGDAFAFDPSAKEQINLMEDDSKKAREAFSADKKVVAILDDLDESLLQCNWAISNRDAEHAALNGLAAGLFWSALQRELAGKGGGRHRGGVIEFIRAAHAKDPEPCQESIIAKGLEDFKKSTGKNAKIKPESYVKKFSERVKNTPPKSD